MNHPRQAQLAHKEQVGSLTEAFRVSPHSLLALPTTAAQLAYELGLDVRRRAIDRIGAGRPWSGRAGPGSVR